MNEIWTADLMNGPKVAGRPSFLAGIIDDRSRFLTGARFVRRPDAVRFAAVLRAAIAAHGVPAHACIRGLCRAADYADPIGKGLLTGGERAESIGIILSVVLILVPPISEGGALWEDRRVRSPGFW